MEFERQFGSWFIPLGICDEADFVSLRQRLDQSSRVGRFGAVTSDPILAAHARRALTHADWTSAVVMDAGLCAVAEVYKLGSRAPGIAEAAFVVELGWRKGAASPRLYCMDVSNGRVAPELRHSRWCFRDPTGRCGN
jgi:hypothetical protein